MVKNFLNANHYLVILNHNIPIFLIGFEIRIIENALPHDIEITIR